MLSWSILQYFLPSFSIHLSLRPLFHLFVSGRFRQVLLYIVLNVQIIFFNFWFTADISFKICYMLISRVLTLTLGPVLLGPAPFPDCGLPLLIPKSPLEVAPPLPGPFFPEENIDSKYT